jgi:hypothetical protein
MPDRVLGHGNSRDLPCPLRLLTPFQRAAHTNTLMICVSVPQRAREPGTLSERLDDYVISTFREFSKRGSSPLTRIGHEPDGILLATIFPRPLSSLCLRSRLSIRPVDHDHASLAERLQIR